MHKPLNKNSKPQGPLMGLLPPKRWTPGRVEAFYGLRESAKEDLFVTGCVIDEALAPFCRADFERTHEVVPADHHCILELTGQVCPRRADETAEHQCKPPGHEDDATMYLHNGKPVIYLVSTEDLILESLREMVPFADQFGFEFQIRPGSLDSPADSITTVWTTKTYWDEWSEGLKSRTGDKR